MRPQWQLISLQVIADATGVVQMDKEELLPLVHQAWQPLKLLFKVGRGIITLVHPLETYALKTYAIARKPRILEIL